MRISDWSSDVCSSDLVDAVDNVAAIARQLDAVDYLGGRRARLGELAGHAANLHDRAGGAEGQHHRHLQHDPEGVAEVVGLVLGEAFRAVAALEQKSLALGTRPEPIGSAHV